MKKQSYDYLPTTDDVAQQEDEVELTEMKENDEDETQDVSDEIDYDE